MITKCDKCGSELTDPTGIDLLAFRLRNAFWKPDSMKGFAIPAWQLLTEDDREGWRRVALVATKWFKGDCVTAPRKTQ